MTDGLCVTAEILYEFVILTKCEKNVSTEKPEGSGVGRDRPEEQGQVTMLLCNIVTAAVTPTIATVIGHSHVQQCALCFQLILSMVVTGSLISFQFYR